MKRFFRSVAAIACLAMTLTFTSCNPAQSALDDLKEFTEELQNDNSEWDEQDFEDAKKEFDEIVTELSKHEYTIEETTTIGKLKIRCAKELGKKSFQKFEKDSKQVMGEISGALEELTK